MASRSLAAAGFVVAILVTLAVAHDLVFLAAYGAAMGEALARTGHDPRWEDAVRTVVLAGAAAVIVAAMRLRRLSRTAADLRAGGEPAVPPLFGRWARTALGLTVGVLVLLVVQENVERFLAGEAIPGIGLLFLPEYGSAFTIVPAVAAVVAGVAALFGWRFAILVARIRAARAVAHRPAAPAIRPATERSTPRPVAPGPLGRRAPPLPSVA